VGVIDEYFEGYYTEEMIESQVWICFDDYIIPVLYACEHLDNIALHLQVDQLVLEEVVRERFPKLGMYFS
jgi:hypothetical protein